MRYFVVKVPGKEPAVISNVSTVRHLDNLPDGTTCYQVWTFHDDVVDTIDYEIRGGRVLLPPRPTHGHTAQWTIRRGRT